MQKFTPLLFFLLLWLGLINQSVANGSQTVGDTANYPYWIEMMQDPNANYYQTVRAFEIYWKDREVTRSSGYKPFKRWQYYWSSRLNPDGTRMKFFKTYQAVSTFLKNYQKKGFEGDFINLGPKQKPVNHTGQPNGNGRVNAVGFHPTDPNILYVGAPAGGLWISNDGGASWSSTTDVLPVLGVSSVVVDPVNTNVIYIGTGDRDAGDSGGMGVFKSTDGGLTFTPFNSGMEDAKVGRLIIDPNDHLTLYAATDKGLFKSTDGGLAWDTKISGNFKEVVFKPDDPSVIYASKSGRFYRSTDAGENWQQNLQVGNHQRAVIGVSEADPEVVYFVAVDNSSYGGTYRSDDAGENWTLMSDTPNIMSWGCNGGTGGQGWYDLDVAVDPVDANVLYVGGVNVFRSSDGGATWNISSHWVGNCGVPGVHADCHVLEFSPLDHKLYAGNDGGLYYTENGGVTWPEISNGLAIGQVYRIGQSALDKDRVINGYQDNGTALFMGETSPFVTVLGGDGMDCVYDHQDPQYSYGEYYFGQGISRIKGDSFNGTISADLTESGAWVTPFILDQSNTNIMYVGMKNLWKGNNIKAVYVSDVTWEKLTTDGNENIRVIEQCSANPEILYFARFYNKGFYRTDNLHGLSVQWVNLKSKLPDNGEITDIETSYEDENVVYITLNNKVFRSLDKGETWEDITLNLPEARVNTIESYKNDPEGLYVGTDAGIYYKNASMNEWMLFSDGFPLSSNVMDLEIFYDPDSPSEDLVRASTYGRGLWSSHTWYGDIQADFEVSDTLIPVGCQVDFKDRSMGVPHSWHWEFEGGIPAESDEKNPSGIQYLNEGVFSVTLTVTNPAGAVTLVKQQLIKVGTDVKPNVVFTSSFPAICAGEKVYFEDHSTGCPQERTWSFNPSTVSYTNGTNEHSINPVVKFNEPGDYDVGLTVSNSVGDSTLWKTAYVRAGGLPIPYWEDFENGTLNDKGWIVDDPDGRKPWTLTQVVGVNNEESQAPYVNLFAYYYTGQRDDLISPALNFEGFDNVYLTFDYAYAQKYAQVDSLIVKVSVDCGNSWTNVFSDGPDMTEHFVTREPMSSEFFPQVKEDWSGRGNYGASSPVINLTPWAGMNSVKIMFETYCGFGNNLFIDNIEVGNAVGVQQQALHEKMVKIFPNPASSQLYVDMKNDKKGMLFLRTLSGRVIKQATIREGLNSINLKSLHTGIYVVQVINRTGVYTEKIVIE